MSSDTASIESQFNIDSGKRNSEKVYEFERFRLDPLKLMLYHDDVAVDLAPKVVETLLALVERCGEIVSKDEMMQRLWADSYVEGANLTQYIYLLRKTLGNASDGKPLIETFRRRGYRFTGKIEGRENKTLGERRARFDSIAVLPFSNESADAGAEYLSDGLTESVINLLSQISQLRVVARSTVFQYRNRAAEAREIGRKLGVSAVLTGRVLRFDERLIVRVELLDVLDGWHVWGEQYNRSAAEIFEMQEAIAREISENLQLKLSAEDRKRLVKRYTENSAVYHNYIKGRHQLNKRLTETVEKAADYFQQAIDVDSTFAPAYVGLADCYPLLSLYGDLTPQEAYPKARAAALKALEIDSLYTNAYNSLGVVKLFFDWDWPGAESAFKQAIFLNPGYPDAHLRYGMLLTATGRFAEAEAEFERARELDPLSLITITISGYPFYYGGELEKAARRFEEVIEMDPTYSMAHFRLGLTLAQMGEYDGAIAEIEKSVALSNDRDTIAALAYVLGLSGNSDTAVSALTELDEREKIGFVSAYDRVLVNLGIGNDDAALDWLEKAYEERSYWLIYMNADPALKPLHSNARFITLRQKIFGGYFENPFNPGR